MSKTKKEIIWGSNKVVGLVIVQGKNTRRFVQIVKRSVRFHSNPVEIVQSIVEIAFQSARIAAAKVQK